jgi:hypothetical protein
MGGFSFSVLFGVSQIFMETNKNCFCNREKSTDYYLKAKKNPKKQNKQTKKQAQRGCVYWFLVRHPNSYVLFHLMTTAL